MQKPSLVCGWPHCPCLSDRQLGHFTYIFKVSTKASKSIGKGYNYKKREQEILNISHTFKMSTHNQ